MAFFATSPAARTSLIYITVGALVLIWTTVWLVFVCNNPPETKTVYYWIGGFMATGAIALLIGFGLGRIGRAAHKAELAMRNPPPVVVPGSPTVVAGAETAVPLPPAGKPTTPPAPAVTVPVSPPPSAPRVGV